jgi:cytochrome c oxidase assembly factor CtaG
VTSQELLTRAWDWDPLVLGACATALAVHANARRAKLDRRSWLMVAAVVVVLLALVSPIGVLARSYLFSAHMLQHLLLLLVAPPLALLSLRPQTLEEGAGAHGRSLARRPYVAWALGVGAMWLWHAPALCDRASQSPSIHYLQTLSLLVMGAGFWWPILAPRASQRLAPFAAIVYLFTACVACTTLGVLVTFSPVEVCSVFAHPVDTLGALPLLQDDWGLTPTSDQQIGGLFMWVPACMVYAVAIVATLGRYYRDEPTKVVSS